MTEAIGAVRVDLETLDSDVGGRVQVVEQSVQDVGGQVSGLDDKVVVLNSRMDASEDAGANIQSSLTNIENQVSGINVLDAESVTGRLTEINAQIGIIRSNIEQP